MRSLILALALAACSRAEPLPELAGETHIADMQYLCSVTNDEAVVFLDENGDVIGMSETGHACDYASWRQDVSENGPIRTRGRLLDYDQWRRERDQRAQR